MEHRLVEGGEEYLPFARSLVKKLQATGLSHASQKHVVGGVSVSVKILPGHEYIRITGSQSKLAMDSGVVEIFAINDTNPASLRSGILYQSSYVTSYTAGYSMQKAKYKEVSYKTNTATKARQIAGFLHFEANQFRGWVPENATEAKSFERKLIKDATTEPPTFTPDPEQLDLIGKKVTTFVVPASIFTGKCRLYVQAMYGSWNNDEDYAGVMPAWTGFDNSVAPALFISTALRDKTDYGALDRGLLLSTNCGVWLNPATGEHWLVVPPSATTTTVFYPLISNGTGEALRKFLVTKSLDVEKIPNTKLSVEDIAHLEAHILAHCLPDRSAAIVVDTPSIFSSKVAQSMSYGWHWNWSGTEAVIVTNVSVFYGMDPIDNLRALYQIESQTSDLKIGWSIDDEGKQKFTAVVTTAAPVHWAIDRRYWTVVHPNFKFAEMYKLTDMWVHMSPGSAVFYAYYIKDELTKCSVSINKTEYALSTTSTPSYFTWLSPTTLGDESGKIDIETKYEMFRVSFTVGGYQTPFIPSSRIQTRIERKSVTDKTKNGPWRGFIVYNYYSSGSPTFPSGDPPYAQVELPLPFNTVSENMAQIGGCTLSELVIETNLVIGGLVAAIPANDSEAICIRAGNHERDVTTGIVTTFATNGNAVAQEGGFWYIRTWWQPGYFNYSFAPPTPVYPQTEDRYVVRTVANVPAGGTNYTTTSAPAVTPPDRIVCDESYLFAGGRATDNTAGFPIAIIQTFLNDVREDTVPVRFSCLSGCGAVDPQSKLVIAQDFGVNVGFTRTGGTDRYVIAGWA